MTLAYAELFAGAGGMSRGLEAAGFTPVAHAEIEPQARAVLRYRWPDTRLDGDVAQINGADYSGITLLSGGSPCQDLSVAGKRAGLGGARSSLFYEQVRIWNESGAPYLLWENVYGALSSNDGRDFAAVLSALVGADVHVPLVRGKPKWKRAGRAIGPTAVAEWRVLDLQYVAGRSTPAPPQRRVRVFVLAYRTNAPSGRKKILIEDGVCWHRSPLPQTEEALAGHLGNGPRLSHISVDLSKPIKLADQCDPCEDCGEPWCADCHAHYADCLCLGPHSLISEMIDEREVMVARMVAFGEYTIDGTASAIKARDYKDATDLVLHRGRGPRRLTPRECERLMGWDDDHTRYGMADDGTVYELSDTARYRLCGNGVGSPCAEWVATRLADAILTTT